MRWSTIVSPVLKLVLLAAGIAGAFYIWNARTPGGPVVPDDDDMQTKPMVTVHVGKVTRQTLRSYAVVQGIVEPAAARPDHPAGSVDIASPVTSTVTEVNVVEGQQITAGQTLLRLDPALAEAALARARSVLDAADSLAKSGEKSALASRDQLRIRHDAAVARADLLAAQAAVDRAALKSTIAGTVTLLNTHPGDTAVAGATLVRVVDLGTMVVNCSIPADRLSAIRADQIAELQRFTGPVQSVVNFVDPGIDSATGTGSVDVTIPATLELRLGDSVTVRIVTAENADCLVVPSTAVTVDDSDRAFVSLVEPGFQFAVRQQVTIGLRDRDYTEISGPGIAPGVDVVTLGTFALTDKSQIRVAP